MDGVVVAAPQETEQVEAVADAAVEVAAIEAEARVEIAAIEAKTQVAAIEAQADLVVAQEESAEEWRRLYETLAAGLQDARQMTMAQAAQIEQLTETLTAQAAAIALLTPPPLLEPQEMPPATGEAAPEDHAPASETDNPSGRKRRWM